MVAVVTGGSRGIGKGIAEELLKNDFTVIITARSKCADVQVLQNTYYRTKGRYALCVFLLFSF